MDTSGRAKSSAALKRRAAWRTLRLWTHAGVSLAVVVMALSGCASQALEQAIGHDPQLYPPVVEVYEWAGRRGDELIVVYRVWGGHPRRHETRWTAVDLRRVAWAEGLGAPHVGERGERLDPVPEPAASDPVPVVQLMGGPFEQEVAVARDRGHAAVDAPVAIYGRGGAAPELVVVVRDASGELRSASWALRPTEDPGRVESAPRTLARGAAGAVDLVTAPAQLLLFMLGVVRVH